MKRSYAFALTLIAILVVFVTSTSAFAQMTYAESPTLAERVASGELPPVQKRLPAQPLVIEDGLLLTQGDVDYSVGTYSPGRTLTSVHQGGFVPVFFLMNIEPLLSAPSMTLENIYGNIVETYEVNEDATIFSFTLREGLKWSDGAPVTTEDVRFAYEDVLLNEELTPNMPSMFEAGGEPMSLDVVDELTFTITFAQKNGGFIRNIALAGWANYMNLLKPRHFLEQFHINYRSADELAQVATDLGLDNTEWTTVFNAKDCARWDIASEKCIGLPQLNPWIVTEVTEGAVIMERNPYYFKVDSAGNQLPYIDRLVSVRVDDVDALKARTLSGEFDAAGIPVLADMPLFREAEAQGGFEARVLGYHTHEMFIIQTCSTDPVVAPVLQDVRFRQAVSYAINREEIIESVYLGFGAPPTWQQGEFNPDEANRLLDEMGMSERGSDGFRLAPDGSPFTFIVEATATTPSDGPVGELIAAQLQEVGINALYNFQDTALLEERLNANESQSVVFEAHQPLWANGAWDDWHPNTTNWCPSYLNWHQEGGSAGTEPYSDDIKRLLELGDLRSWAVPGSEEDQGYYAEQMEILSRNLWIIDVASDLSEGLVIRNDLRNVASGGTGLALFRAGEQWFFAAE